MGKTEILAILLAMAGFVVWMLDVQQTIHEALRDDLEWRLQLESTVDEHHRVLCVRQPAPGHLDCGPSRQMGLQPLAVPR